MKMKSSSSLSSILDRMKHCNMQAPCFPSSRIRKSYCNGVSTLGGGGSGTLLHRKRESPLPVEIVVSEAASSESPPMSPFTMFLNENGQAELEGKPVFDNINSLGRRTSRSLNGSVSAKSFATHTSSMSLPSSNKRRSKSASKDTVQLGFYDDNGFIRTAYRSEKYNYLGKNCPSPSQTRSTPKINPCKTQLTIQSILRGLSVCISALKAAIDNSPSKSLHLQVKTLEYQQSRLQVLQEEYDVQQKLREGVRSMAYAYNHSTGKERDIALANVKAGFKECSEVIAGLDKQVKEFMGGFRLRMKGVQGFARLCPGDTYEITLKHGHQKWKTRGKTGKDLSQIWDVPETEIVALLGEDLFIKAAEVKMLGKQVLLGNKFCDIGELMAAHSQLMTVNLNPSGSLKLNIVVEWNPLAQFYVGRETPVVPRKTLLSRSPSPERQENINSSLCEGIYMLECMLEDEVDELDALKHTVKALKEFSGKANRFKLVKTQSGCSLNVESALECFDFLDACEVNQTPTPSRKSKKMSHVIEQETPQSSSSSRSPSPSPPGSDSLQMALQAHVQICLRQCQKLGPSKTSTPLQAKRKLAIRKLEKQEGILAAIHNRIRKGGGADPLDDLADLPFTQTLWRVITENDPVFCTTADKVASSLEKYLDKDYENSSLISRRLVEYITEESYEESSVVTLFQFLRTLRPYETCFGRLVNEIVDEERLSEEVQTPKNVVKVLEQLAQMGTSPRKLVAERLIRYLGGDESDNRVAIVLYFEDMPNNLKAEMTEICLQQLESEDALTRLGALVLLRVLKPDATDEIANYLSKTDIDPDIGN